MSNSKRKCGGCGEYFKPDRTFPGPVAWCSSDCALIVARKRLPAVKASQAKQERKANREARERIKTRSEWLKESQAAVNSYVRERDKDLPCVSCGRHHEGQYHAGHYRSVGSAPELRFETRQIHKQCQPCNNHLSGNLIPYRQELLKRVGADVLEWIEGPHQSKKYTIDDLRSIRDDYRARLKSMRDETKGISV
jgi:hypothetical protein